MEDKIFKTSSYSGNDGCVAVMRTSSRVMVRDSKQPDRAELEFNFKEWKAFLAGVKDAEFDV